MRLRLLFLKYILNEKPESFIYNFLHLKFENPIRGDWAFICNNSINALKLNLSLEDIKMLTKAKFNNVIKIYIRTCALEYLLGKQGSKGHDIIYSEIKLAECMLPNDSNLKISPYKDIFEVRNRMLSIPHNFPTKEKYDKCVKCEQTEDILHIYNNECWRI